MLTIVIQNSYCFLENETLQIRRLVASTLTYEDAEKVYQLKQLKFQLQMAYRRKWGQKIGYYKKQLAVLGQNTMVCWLEGNRFPTGHLKLVRDALDQEGHPYELLDLRESPTATVDFRWKVEMPPPRYYQEEMLEVGVFEHRGVFESAVGSGKSYVTQLLIQALGVPTLVILPSKDLAVQTHDSIANAFGAPSVALIASAAQAKTTKPIRVCTVHTLMALLKKKQLERFLAPVGMIIIDEVHHAGAKSYTALLPYFSHIYYRFGFSGTFMRNDSRTLDMWGFLSTVLYRYPASKAITEGYLTPVQLHVHPVDGRRGNTYHSEYNKNYCENKELLNAIGAIINWQVEKNEQVLILVGRKDKSGKLIHEYLDELGINNAYISGDSDRGVVRDTLKAFNDKKVRVLIGSSIIGEGIDIRSTDHLIMAQGGISEIAITQAVGRAVRLYPGKEVAHIHDFKFLGTRYLETHLKNRIEIYRRGFACSIEDGDMIDAES